MAVTAQGRRINGYHCRVCIGFIWVEHLDEGVTPMFLACRATEGCNGQMQSMMYAEPPFNMPPDYLHVCWQWYKPDEEQLATMSESMQQHINMGGVALRRIACSQEGKRPCQHPNLDARLLG